jgi:hypothetical protein
MLCMHFKYNASPPPSQQTRITCLLYFCPLGLWPSPAVAAETPPPASPRVSPGPARPHRQLLPGLVTHPCRSGVEGRPSRLLRPARFPLLLLPGVYAGVTRDRPLASQPPWGAGQQVRDSGTFAINQCHVIRPPSPPPTSQVTH